jgi:cyclopropane-fatty-acyl-phospholipid synthase
MTARTTDDRAPEAADAPTTGAPAAATAPGPAPTGGRLRSLVSRFVPPAPIAPQISALLGDPPDVAVRAYDGSRSGPDDAAATLDFVRPTAFTRLLSAPGELGFGRAIVSGDLAIKGDLLGTLELRHHLNEGRGKWYMIRALLRLAITSGAPLKRLAPPPEEVRVKGHEHTKRYDEEAVSQHYDAGNDFYRLMLGPSMAYTCAVWENPDVGLDAAQEAKFELVCKKLDLKPGMRVLDVGCGWGSFLIHAAKHHGVRGVGVTLSSEQAAFANKAIAEAGLSDQVEVQVKDYRDVDDGPYDAVASIGIIESIGHDQLDVYANHLYGLLRPGGRLLTHGVTAKVGGPNRIDPRGFLYRYCFPGGAVHELSAVVDSHEKAGFEVRHIESLRESYALTCRAWMRNLEDNWDEARALVGEGRIHVWHLYITACINHFHKWNGTLTHTLAVKNRDGSTSDMPLRPNWG